MGSHRLPESGCGQVTVSVEVVATGWRERGRADLRGTRVGGHSAATHLLTIVASEVVVWDPEEKEDRVVRACDTVPLFPGRPVWCSATRHAPRRRLCVMCRRPLCVSPASLNWRRF